MTEAHRITPTASADPDRAASGSPGTQAAEPGLSRRRRWPQQGHHAAAAPAWTVSGQRRHGRRSAGPAIWPITANVADAAASVGPPTPDAAASVGPPTPDAAAAPTGHGPYSGWALCRGTGASRRIPKSTPTPEPARERTPRTFPTQASGLTGAVAAPLGWWRHTGAVSVHWQEDKPAVDGQVVDETEDFAAADRQLVAAYRCQPPDHALVESTARMAARTAPEL